MGLSWLSSHPSRDQLASPREKLASVRLPRGEARNSLLPAVTNCRSALGRSGDLVHDRGYGICKHTMTGVNVWLIGVVSILIKSPDPPCTAFVQDLA